MKWIGFRLRLIGSCVAALFGLFVAARLALLIFYGRSHFVDLSTVQIIQAFARGIIFDASAYLSFAGLPLLLLIFGGSSRVGGWWTRGWLWVLVFVVGLMTVVLVGDILYFPYVKRHLYDELLLLGADFDFLVTALVESFWAYALGFLIVCAVIIMRMNQWMRREFPSEPYSIPKFIVLLLVFGLLIRGSFSLKPISIVDAYASGNTAQGDLILNGVFTAWHGSLKIQSAPPSFFERATALNHLKTCGLDWSGEYPLQKRFDSRSPSDRPNVIVILLESWFNHYVGSFGGKFPGLTPEFDRIARIGIRYPNFFANGSRSIEAIQAILTGFPSLNGIPDLGIGFEMVQTGSLARYAKAEGYQTSFSQASARRSFRLDSAAGALGFDQYYGREDYTLTLPYPDKIEPVFGYDYEMLQKNIEVADQLTQPFLSFAFTGTTHTPFILPPHFYRKEGHGTETETGFLNTLRYSDWSLGEYFRIASTKPWFANTLFVITADHTFPRFEDFSVLERFRVPLVLVKGSEILTGVEAQRQDGVYGSHLDILPSIIDLAGWGGDFAFAGHSLVSQHDQRCVFLSGRFGNPVIATPQGYLVHSHKTRLESSFDDSCTVECQDQKEAALLSFHQILQETYRKSRVVHRP
jgi:phosphoglycerol transferase MdoB-like AlkP superfamily enzyme